MTPTNVDGPYAHAAGWLVSSVLHGSFALGAFLFVQHVQLAPQPAPFKWNVAMVTTERPSTSTALASPASNTPPTHTKPTPAITPRRIPHVVPLSESTKVNPVPQPTPVAPTTPVTTRAMMSEPQSSHAMTQVMATTPAAKPIEVAQPEPVVPPIEKSAESVKTEPTRAQQIEQSQAPTHTEPAPTASQTERIGKTDSAYSVPEPPVPAASTTPQPAPMYEPTEPTPSLDTPSPGSTPSTQIASIAAPPSRASIKPDYGWLSEMILRRVEELKRYPAEARLDRAEGKVVLKAVIRDDGSVDDVEVFQSSGNQSLDHAALELMKQAAPFHMPHPLGKSKVVVKIPMSYRLDR